MAYLYYVRTYHELSDLFFGFPFSKTRLEIIVDLFLFIFKLLERIFTFFSLDRICDDFILSIIFSLLLFAREYAELHSSFRTVLSCSWRNHFVNFGAEFVHGIRIMPLILVVPSKCIFTLLLLPKDLKHGSIVD